MKNRKRRIYAIAIFALVIFYSFCFAQEQVLAPDTVTKIIKQLQYKYCPDKRISRFEVNPKLYGNKIILIGETLSLDGKSELIGRLTAETNYQIGDSIMVLPEPAVGRNRYGVIRISVAQLRRNPDEIYETVDQAIMGTEVRVLKIKDKYWIYCQLDDDYLGWMTVSSLKIGDNKFINNWRDQEKLIVTANYGQIWEQRKENTISVSDLVRGNLLINRGKKGGWYEVELPDGRRGYVRSNLIREENKYIAHLQPTPASLVNLAYQFIGIPYLWGGRSTKGFDCSGFTQIVFKLNGVQLPRDANMQVKVGQSVDLDDSLKNVQTGDLLFFGEDIERIWHVGMYIGDEKFIHSDGMVKINSFNPRDENYSEYRRRGLQAVRRVLGN